MPLIKHTARSRGIVAMIGWFGMLVFLVYGAITARTEWMWAHAMRPRTFANQLSGPPIPREEVLPSRVPTPGTHGRRRRKT